MKAPHSRNRTNEGALLVVARINKIDHRASLQTPPSKRKLHPLAYFFGVVSSQVEKHGRLDHTTDAKANKRIPVRI